eukprot:CAMPEP_0167779134 /NCGR_PEP_ID=MMETSP0111_2-20121227/4644_1 /TAXON_ID=91324 /ORGANISM="Lotharella globosa, Strain CCCM811" /LENGTH=389 /DNA_ID=CAMNT_0007669523 /DNA_START=18 /DNA_END=1187 /DNA_ORIENTATION=-
MPEGVEENLAELISKQKGGHDKSLKKEADKHNSFTRTMQFHLDWFEKQKKGGAQSKPDSKTTARKPTKPGADVFSIRFSPLGHELAVACLDGTVRIVDPKTTKTVKTLNTSKKDAAPITSVRYRPAASTTKNVLICSTGDGEIQYWHVPSSKKIFEIKEDNEILALDYSMDSEYFASAGKDKVVRVYDEKTKSLLVELQRGLGSRDSDGHSGRIFCVKFHPKDPNMILSTGWDDTIHVWDIRAGMSVKTWGGPHVCGDAMDVFEDVVITGSWRERNGLQVWNLADGKLIREIDYHNPEKKNESLTDHIYGACFNFDGSKFAAGGSHTNELRVYDVRNHFRRSQRIRTKGKGVYAVAFSSNGKYVAAGSQCGWATICDLNPHPEEDEDDD